MQPVDYIGRRAAALKMAHPLMLRAIAAAKKKNDRIDATACAAIFCPECYMAPTAIRERRRSLRYRNLLVRQMVQMDPSRVLGKNCGRNGRPNWGLVRDCIPKATRVIYHLQSISHS
jgi:hypothetical protein